MEEMFSFNLEDDKFVCTERDADATHFNCVKLYLSFVKLYLSFVKLYLSFVKCHSYQYPRHLSGDINIAMLVYRLYPNPYLDPSPSPD